MQSACVFYYILICRPLRQSSILWSNRTTHDGEVHHQSFTSLSFQLMCVPFCINSVVVASNRINHRDLFYTTNFHPTRFLRQITFFCNIVVKSPSDPLLRRLCYIVYLKRKDYIQVRHRLFILFFFFFITTFSRFFKFFYNFRLYYTS